MAASLTPRGEKGRARVGRSLRQEATRTGPAEAFGRTSEDRGDHGRRQGVVWARQEHSEVPVRRPAMRLPSFTRKSGAFTTFLRVFPMSPVPPDWTQTRRGVNRRNRRKTGVGRDFRRSQCVNHERSQDVLSILRKGKSGPLTFGKQIVLDGRQAVVVRRRPMTEKIVGSA